MENRLNTEVHQKRERGKQKSAIKTGQAQKCVKNGTIA